jgi:hypothetical protein
LRAAPRGRGACAVPTRSGGRSSEPPRVVEEFGRRRDVTPEAFGFCVEETPEGPSYRWAGPSAEETIEQLRRAGILDEDHFE